MTCDQPDLVCAFVCLCLKEREVGGGIYAEVGTPPCINTLYSPYYGWFMCLSVARTTDKGSLPVVVKAAPTEKLAQFVCLAVYRWCEMIRVFRPLNHQSHMLCKPLHT